MYCTAQTFSRSGCRSRSSTEFLSSPTSPVTNQMIGATPHTNYTHRWHHLFFLFLILFFHFFPLLPLQAYDWAHHLPWGELAVPWTWTDVPSFTSCQLHH